MRDPEVFEKTYEALGLEGKGIISFVGAGGKTSLCFRLGHELAAQGKLVLVTTTTKMMEPSKNQAQVRIFSKDLRQVVREAVWLKGKGRVVFAAHSFSHEEGKVLGFEPEAFHSILEDGPFDWILIEADGSRGLPIKAPNEREPVVPEGSGWVVGVIGLDSIGKPLGPQWAFRWELLGQVAGVYPGRPITEESIGNLALHPKGLFKGCPGEAKRTLFLNKVDIEGAFEGAMRVAEHLQDLCTRRFPLAVIAGSAIKGEKFWKWSLGVH